jgi:S1-C subfamily serine protease
MERNEDDMPMGDLPDGEGYPPAPVPPHERAWRHPSEVAASQWTSTEPPLVLGRGLMVTTGVVGVLLTGALVWAMLPRAGAPVTATSSLLAVGEPGTPTTVAVTTQPPANDVATTAVVTTTTPATAPPTTVAPPAVPVVALAHDPTALATSVVVGEQVFLITTLVAVGERVEIEVIGNDGEVSDAEIVWSDTISGLVVLAAPTVDIAGSLRTASLPEPGTSVTVMAASGALGANLATDLAGAPMLDGISDEQLPEGSPVVDTEGRVVGLCRGANVVPVNLQAAVRERLAELRGWMGVRLPGSADAAPVVVGLEFGGPAEEAGLLDGDKVLTVDGRAVASVADLQWMIARHLPGDTVVLEVMRAGEPLGGIEVVLVERPTNL